MEIEAIKNTQIEGILEIAKPDKRTETTHTSITNRIGNGRENLKYFTIQKINTLVKNVKLKGS